MSEFDKTSEQSSSMGNVFDISTQRKQQIDKIRELEKNLLQRLMMLRLDQIQERLLSEEFDNAFRTSALDETKLINELLHDSAEFSSLTDNERTDFYARLQNTYTPINRDEFKKAGIHIPESFEEPSSAKEIADTVYKTFLKGAEERILETIDKTASNMELLNNFMKKVDLECTDYINRLKSSYKPTKSDKKRMALLIKASDMCQAYQNNSNPTKSKSLPLHLKELRDLNVFPELFKNTEIFHLDKHAPKPK